MPLTWRSGKTLKGKPGITQSLFHIPLTAISNQNRTGCTPIRNTAENGLIPQLRLGSRRKSIIKNNGRPNSTPKKLRPQLGNIRTTLVQHKPLTHIHILLPRASVHKMKNLCKTVGNSSRMLPNNKRIIKPLNITKSNRKLLNTPINNLRVGEPLQAQHLLPRPHKNTIQPSTQPHIKNIHHRNTLRAPQMLHPAPNINMHSLRKGPISGVIRLPKLRKLQSGTPVCTGSNKMLHHSFLPDKSFSFWP